MHGFGWRLVLLLAAVMTTLGIQARAQLPSERAPARIEVSIRHSGGVFTVPVTINDTLTLDFVLDSGAADVQIPADVFTTLARAGAFSESDLRESRAYTTADGSLNRQSGLVIRSLRLGEITLHDVQASVGGPASSLLLGQSFLQRFSGWAIDNPRQKLILDQGGVHDVTSAAPSTPPALPPPTMELPTGPQPGDERPDVYRLATVRAATTVVFAEPDQASKVIVRLSPGSSVVVHRVFWNMLLQWAEVNVGSGVGFVVSSDIDLGNG